MNHSHPIKVHGHRGWRSAFPENSIVGFVEATKLGVDALELDVVIDADGQIIVSHDPFMHHEICVKPDGSPILAEEELSFNIYRMHEEERLAFKNPPPVHPRFPLQNRNRFGPKPTLHEVLNAVNFISDSIGVETPLWNIEMKSQPEWDHVFHPEPADYARFFLDEILRLNLQDKCVIQCFDARVLNELNKLSPNLKLVYLSEDEGLNVQEKLAMLSFKPYGYSPNYKLVTQQDVELCRRLQIELLVWTVNEEQDMKAMIDLGVKHIITDYPERLLSLTGRLKH